MEDNQIRCRTHKYNKVANLSYPQQTEVVKQPTDPGATATNLRQKIFDKEIDIYVKRLDAYNLNTRILYNVIWSQCSEPMRSKLKLSDSFDDIESNRNALALLKEVQRVSSNFSTQRYVCLALYDAIQSFYRVHQAKDQPASDYLSKFKVLYQSIKHYGGTIGEDPILVREEIRRAGVVMPESYDRGDIIFDLYLTPARQRYLAYMFLKGADETRYAGMMLQLENNYTLGSDNFPSNVTDAYNMMVNYKSDHVHHKKATTSSNSHGYEKSNNFVFAGIVNNKGEEVVCYRCGDNHYANDPICAKGNNSNGNSKAATNEYSSIPAIVLPQLEIPSSPSPSSSSNDDIIIDEVPTINPSLPSPSSSSNDDINMEQVFAAIDDNIKDSYDPGNFVFATIGHHISSEAIFNAFGHRDLSSWIIMDSGASVSIFMNKDMVQSISKVPAGHELTVQNNVGAHLTNQKCIVDGYGSTWFNPDSVTNIISLSEISTKFKVDFNFINQSFTVHVSNTQKLVFKALNGLYVFIPGDYVINPGKKPSDIPSSSSNVFVQTIADNESLFTAREVRDAKEARRVFINLGRDGIKNFRFMVLHHLIKNITFNASDVDRV